MILTCPSCAANFLIDPAHLGHAGRKVRCAKCKHEWHASKPIITLPPDEGTLPPFADGASQSSHGDTAVDTNNPQARRNAVLFGVVLALLLALPLLAFLYPKKPEPAGAPEHSAPATETAKAETVKGSTITLDGVPATLLKQEQGRGILSIEGALINKGKQTQKVPALKAEALDAKRHVVKEWDIPISTENLDAGQRLPFTFTTPFNEQGVVDIAFRFVAKE